MERIKISKNFFLDEYIPKKLYIKYEKKPYRLLAMLDGRLVNADQLLRNEFGPITINNWWNDKDRNWSGIRTPDSKDYSFTSQHTWGRASDKIFHTATAEQVREFIKQYWKKLGITCIEDDINWVHSDTRWWSVDELLIVKPPQ